MQQPSAAAGRVIRAGSVILYEYAIRQLVTEVHRETVLAQHYDRLAKLFEKSGREEDADEAITHGDRHRVRACLAEHDLAHWLSWTF